MLSNYLKTAIRSITKNRFHAALNILGLAIGLATFIFIMLWVQNEASYDKHHAKSDRIFRIESDFTISGKHDRFAIVPVPMGPALKLEFPEVEEFCRFYNDENLLIKYNNKEFYENHFFFTDSSVFKLFTHKIIAGDPVSCLVEPNSIVLTQSIASKYFGDENPKGKILETGNQISYKVTGLIEDLPQNSHLRFDALMSFNTIAQLTGAEQFNSMEPGNFWNIGVFTYLLLNENAAMVQVHDKFDGFYDKYMKPVGDALNASFNLLSTPLAKTHFEGNYSSDLPKGNMTYVYILSAIAIFILLIASINYMNMATARSEKRAREVGIRKVAGAHRSQLIAQFISESVVTTFVSLVIALILVYGLMDEFSLLAGKSFLPELVFQPALLFTIMAIALILGIFSGAYPAIYLSSARPVTVIKGSGLDGGRKSSRLRKLLVTFQFVIAISLIIGTLVVSDQLRFLQNKDMGFINENIIVLEVPDTSFHRKIESFKAELINNPNIEAVTNSTGIPFRTGWVQVIRVEKDTAMIEDAMVINQVDHEFLEAYGIQLTQGRNFDREMRTDTEEAVIVNEAAVAAYGWGDDPIGKRVHWGAGLDGEGGRMLRIIGIAKDYHFTSLHNKVEPAMLFLGPFNKRYLSIRVRPENFGQTLSFVEEKWHAFGAQIPFNYQMLNEIQSQNYHAEIRLGKLLATASFLTIFTALLGLLGLSSFMAEQKTREIGIRKVMGAGFGQILTLLYREFFFLILIAFVIAIPIAVWQLQQWLDQNFIYHNGISFLTVIISGLMTTLISMIALSYHTIRAGLSNPVDAIKYE